MEIKVIKNPISLEKVQEMARDGKFAELVKAVVDVEQEIMALGGELHADEESELMEKNGSKRENTWGINIYPEKSVENFIEFDSMINLKPAFGNRSRGVEDLQLREKIKGIVDKLVLK